MIYKRTHYKMPQYIEGYGFLDDLKLKQYMPHSADALSRYGDQTVNRAKIIRTPLNSMLTSAIDALSNNRYSKMVKRNGYDGYFHLAMVFPTAMGPLTIEKNESVHIAPGDPSVRNTQAMHVNLPSTTIKQLMANTQRAQGSKFYLYNASSNNCQIFIHALLQSNGVTDPAVLSWVRQDTESIFKGQPALRKIANTVTDMANVAMGASQIPRLLQRKVEQKTRAPLRQAGRTVSRGIKKLFGRGIGGRMLVKDMKELIKANKNAFGRKILISKLKKPQLQALVDELQDLA